MSRKFTIDEIKEFAKSKNIEFLSEIYTGSQNKHRWRCKKCNHEWEALPNSIKYHYVGSCPRCSNRVKKTIDDMHELAKSRNFEFLSSSYKGIDTKCLWKCPNGHIWEAIPWTIMRGSGCPKCTHFVSEERCRFVFESLTEKKFPQNNKVLGNRLELDGYCEELNLAFEYQGQQHYEFVKRWHKTESKFLQQRKKDLFKTDLCRKKKIRKTNIPYFRIKTNEKLEKLIKKFLQKFDIEIIGELDWTNFTRKSSYLQKIRDLAEKRNIKCLSIVYINSITPLKFQCLKCNYAWETKPVNIQQGKGCPKCGRAIKKTIQEMHELAKSRNFEFLSKKYINVKVKYKWKCLECGNEWNSIYTNIRGGSGCPKCAEEKRKETRRRNHPKIHQKNLQSQLSQPL